LGLLDSYNDVGVTETSAPFEGPFILPNPVNIQSGWKVPSPVIGRYATIEEVLRSWSFGPTDRIVLTNSLQGVEFLIPSTDKMICYGHIAGALTNDPSDRKLLKPFPNSQDVLLKTTAASGGTVLLTTNTPGYRIAGDGFVSDAPHFSIYQMQDMESRDESEDCEFHLEIANEFALWIIMELGYHSLDHSAEQRKEIPPLEETDQLRSALTWAVSRFYTAEDLAYPSYSTFAEEAGGDWLQRVACASDEDQIFRIFPYLATVLKDVLISNGKAPNYSSDFSTFTYLKALRGRQKEYLTRCKNVSDPAKVVLDISSDPSVALRVPASIVLAWINQDMNESRCLSDRKEIDPSQPPFSLGLYSLGHSDTTSFKAYPDVWLRWTDPKEKGLVFGWTGYYSEVLSAARYAKFYSRFSAKTYYLNTAVTNKAQGQTESSQIFGLALAMSTVSPARTAFLLLPHTIALDWASLSQLATAYGTTLANLFGLNKLAIQQSHARRLCATIDGSDSPNVARTNDNSVDTLLDLSLVDPRRGSSSFGLVNKLLTDGKPQPSPLNTVPSSFQRQPFFISTESNVGNETLYLQINADGLKNHSKSDAKEVLPPPFKVSTEKPQFGLDVIEIPSDESSDAHIAMFGPGPFASGDAIPHKVPPVESEPGSHHLRIEYPADSGRRFGFYKGQRSGDKPLISLLKSADDLFRDKREEVSFSFQKLGNGKNRQTSQKSASVSLSQFLLDTRAVQKSKLDPTAFTLPHVLALLPGYSVESATALLFARLPTALVNSGLVETSIVDTTKSIINAYTTVLGTMSASRAELICSRKSPDGATFELIPGVKIQTDAIKVSVQNVRTPRCTIATSTIAVLDDSLGTLSATTSFALTGNGKDIPLWSLKSTNERPSLTQLSTRLGLSSLSNHDTETMKACPPFFKSALYDILTEDRIGDFELKYNQIVPGLPGCACLTAGLSIRSDDWREAIPDTLTVKNIQAHAGSMVRLEVQNPSHDAFARVNVSIDFTGAVQYAESATKKELTLPFSMSAIPLVRRGDFEYRLFNFEEQGFRRSCQGLGCANPPAKSRTRNRLGQDQDSYANCRIRL
jgi:hypothetical protein